MQEYGRIDVRGGVGERMEGGGGGKLSNIAEWQTIARPTRDINQAWVWKALFRHIGPQLLFGLPVDELRHMYTWICVLPDYVFIYSLPHGGFPSIFSSCASITFCPPGREDRRFFLSAQDVPLSVSFPSRGVTSISWPVHFSKHYSSSCHSRSSVHKSLVPVRFERALTNNWISFLSVFFVFPLTSFCSTH